MRIGIEAQRIFRKKKHGMDIVALELIRNLQRMDRENEYFVFVRPDVDNNVIRETVNFKIVEINTGSYPAWEQISLPGAAKKFGCNVLHCTSNTGPLFSTVPLVITLHDIIYMESTFPQHILGKGSPYQKFGNSYRKLIVPRLIKKCRKIITVSEFEKRKIASFFNLQSDNRLMAVYNGVSEYFRPVVDTDTSALVKKKYHLPDRFFFFLGNTHPKKNTPGTLKAFSEFLKETGSDVKLVMIDFDQAELSRILHEINDPGLRDKIVLTGYISNTDLPAIYSQCSLFLYPSLRESFGIPIIEAMACGAPVITSNTSSMPEIAGDAALLVDPFSPASITGAMKQVNSDSVLRKNMIQKGLIRSAKFSWKAMAEQVVQTYQEIAGEGRLHSEFAEGNLHQNLTKWNG